MHPLLGLSRTASEANDRFEREASGGDQAYPSEAHLRGPRDDLAVNLLLIAVWALGRGYFWPIWPILGWGVALALHYWTVFLQRPISEDEIRREMKKGP